MSRPDEGQARPRRYLPSKRSLPRVVFPSVDALLAAQDIATVRGRAKAALLGAFVADAACMGLHWLPAKAIAALLAERKLQYRPEFLDPPACQAYHYKSGGLSPLAEELLPLLQSMITHGGFYGPHFLQTCHTAYTAHTGYHSPLAKAICAAVSSGEHYPWAAVSDGTVACLLKMPAMVARYGGKQELVVKAHDAVRAHQDGSDARILGIAFARILERIVLGQSIAETLVWASTEDSLDGGTQRLVQRALKAQNVQHTDAVVQEGPGSQAAACFYGALHAAAASASYADAVRKTAVGGGENAGRAQLVGALFAAQDGLEAVPVSWQSLVTKLPELENLADQLVAQRVIISIL